jgi:hypothetical protein
MLFSKKSEETELVVKPLFCVYAILKTQQPKKQQEPCYTFNSRTMTNSSLSLASPNTGMVSSQEETTYSWALSRIRNYSEKPFKPTISVYSISPVWQS